MKTAWVVGKVTNHAEQAWEMIGVFESEVLARQACRTIDYFIGPTRLNEALPDETAPWVGAYYPLRQEQSTP